MKMLNVFNRLAAVMAVLALTGCIGLSSTDKRAVVPEGIPSNAALQPDYELIPPAEGSLWSEHSAPFFEDTKARNPGDTVVIDIVENSSSSMDVNTETSRDTSMDIGVPNFFGYMRQFEPLDNPVTKGMLADKMVGTSYTNSFC